MVRLLYAGYLAFALYIIYPMVQNYLAADEACLRGASSMSVAAAVAPPASDARKRNCALEARVNVVAGRSGEVR
ncbi:hypothetical protein WI38_22320 [Burkholderia ubonensis]|uniref:Uncharacterized protein n=1 Tax=Burkholderia ubonensis TaxID=101571 RepID=A0A117X7A4_9BURK|nr:hypothetical protein [Burkholderia ubonensis]KUZ59760.1 hypothetical protein WI35_31435 [Burkholderia ubonensis]KUZ59803.1 hypothetical protein WI35_31690 [Burkholderia ubonensis]KUZ86602.1 hypothetical protein WI38_22320 [Burkholderia ubonensis]KUZ96272.1 hypothetical protein WI39_11610 [Burkholderia ubonensis]